MGFPHSNKTFDSDYRGISVLSRGKEGHVRLFLRVLKSSGSLVLATYFIISDIEDTLYN